MAKDKDDMPSTGIYLINLERLCRKKGIDVSFIDRTLTYGENKNSLNLEPEGYSYKPKYTLDQQVQILKHKLEREQHAKTRWQLRYYQLKNKKN